MIRTGALSPELLIGRTIGLDEVPVELPAMNEFATSGVTVIDRF